MIVLYYRIFVEIHARSKKPVGSVKTPAAAEKALVIENTLQTSRLTGNGEQSEEGAVKNRRLIDKMKHQLPLITETDAVTNTGSGGSAVDEEDADGDDQDDSDIEHGECHVIKNEKTTEFEGTVKRAEEVPMRTLSPTPTPITGAAGITDGDLTTTTNGNSTSGYVTLARSTTSPCLY